MASVEKARPTDKDDHAPVLRLNSVEPEDVSPLKLDAAGDFAERCPSNTRQSSNSAL
jgi:hypothetical protein